MKKLGSIFVELKLNDSQFRSSVQKNKQLAESAAKDIEKTSSASNTRSLESYNQFIKSKDIAQRKAVDSQIRTQDKAAAAIMQANQNAYNRIKKVSDDYTAHDAKANYQRTQAQNKAIDSQMRGWQRLKSAQDKINYSRLTQGINSARTAYNKSLGPQKTFMQQTMETSKHMIQAAPGFAVATAAIAGVYSALRGIGNEFTRGLAAVEKYKISVVKMAAIITTFSDKATLGNIPGAYKEATIYAEDLVQALERLDAQTVATGMDLMTMAETFAQHGVLLDLNNKKAVDGFLATANALKILTAGQNQDIQMRQEINSLMMGTLRHTDRLGKFLDRQVPNLKEQVHQWRLAGTLLENMVPLLEGFNIASKDIEYTWDSVGSTMTTIHNKILREAFADAFESLLGLAKRFNDALFDVEGNLTPLAEGIKNIIKSALNGFGQFEKIVAGVKLLTIAIGTRLVAAVALSATTFTIGRVAAVSYQMSLLTVQGVSTRVAAGQLALAGATRVAAGAMTMLKGAMGLLGGPLGVAIFAATAIFSFRKELGLVESPANDAASAIDSYTESVEKLTVAQAEQQRMVISGKLEEAESEANRLKEQMRGTKWALQLPEDPSFKSYKELEIQLINTAAQYDTVSQKADGFKEALKGLNEIIGNGTPQTKLKPLFAEINDEIKRQDKQQMSTSMREIAQIREEELRKSMEGEITLSQEKWRKLLEIELENLDTLNKKSELLEKFSGGSTEPEVEDQRRNLLEATGKTEDLVTDLIIAKQRERAAITKEWTEKNQKELEKINKEANEKLLKEFEENARAADKVAEALDRVTLAAMTSAEREQTMIERQRDRLRATVTQLEMIGEIAPEVATKMRKVFGQKAQEDIDALTGKSKTLGKTLLEGSLEWARGYSNSLNEMLWNSEMTFSSILESFGKMITEMLIQSALVDLFGNGKKGEDGKSGILSSLATEAVNFDWGSLFGSTVASANGNVFASPGLSAYSNSIVSSPTTFPFAKGIGLMGEAGPEAIMPLERNSKGKLGVAVANGTGTDQKMNERQEPPQVNTRIVNVMDQSIVGDYLATSDGEQIIMNIIQKNGIQ